MGEEIADSSTQGEVPLLHLPFNVEKDSTSLTVSFRESVKTKLILFRKFHVDIDIEGLSQLSGWLEKCSLL